MVTNQGVLDKYNKIWDKIKNKFGIQFHSKPVYDRKYIKANLMVGLKQTF